MYKVVPCSGSTSGFKLFKIAWNKLFLHLCSATVNEKLTCRKICIYTYVNIQFAVAKCDTIVIYLIDYNNIYLFLNYLVMQSDGWCENNIFLVGPWTILSSKWIRQFLHVSKTDLFMQNKTTSSSTLNALEILSASIRKVGEYIIHSMALNRVIVVVWMNYRFKQDLTMIYILQDRMAPGGILQSWVGSWD